MHPALVRASPRSDPAKTQRMAPIDVCISSLPFFSEGYLLRSSPRKPAPGGGHFLRALPPSRGPSSGTLGPTAASPLKVFLTQKLRMRGRYLSVFRLLLQADSHFTGLRWPVFRLDDNFQGSLTKWSHS